MLSLLVGIRALGPAIRIRAHIGDTLWDRALRPPILRLPHRILPRIAHTNIWGAEQSRQRGKIEKSGTGAPVALMCEIPHRDFERGARLPLKLKNWFEQPKGDTTMFPLSCNSLKMAAASAIVALAIFAAPVNAYERVQKLGPVAAYQPILTTIGNKNVVAFFTPGNGQCNIEAVFWNADYMAAKSDR